MIGRFRKRSVGWNKTPGSLLVIHHVPSGMALETRQIYKPVIMCKNMSE